MERRNFIFSTLGFVLINSLEKAFSQNTDNSVSINKKVNDFIDDIYLHRLKLNFAEKESTGYERWVSKDNMYSSIENYQDQNEVWKHKIEFIRSPAYKGSTAIGTSKDIVLPKGMKI